MGMGAVGEAAVLGIVENFLEITCQFLGLHIEGAKALDAWCINHPPTLHGNHLGECGSMKAGVVGIGDLGGAEVGAWHEAVDEGGLPYPAVAAKEGNLAGQQLLQGVDALACGRRNLQALVADGLIEGDHHLLIAGLVGREQVGLVEDEDNGHTIGLGRGEETIDESGRRLRIVDGDDEQRLIDIGGDDMTLLGEVDALADDIVAAILNLGDEGCTLLVGDNLNTITHSNRVGATDTLQAKVALHLTIKKLVIVCEDGVPAACVLNDETFQIIPS